MPISELSTGVVKTLSGDNEIAKTDRATYTSANTGHDNHARLPHGQCFGCGDGGGHQTLFELTERDDPDASWATRNIRNQIGGALADTALKLKPSDSLDPPQLFVQAGQQKNICTIIL